MTRQPLEATLRAEVDRLAGRRFFASSGFAALWRHRGGRPVVWLVESDGRVAAALPGVEFGRGPLARFQSMPDGCYGGLLLDPDLAADRLPIGRAVMSALARHHYVKACVFDFYGTIADPAPFGGGWEETTLLDIAVPGWLPPDRKLNDQIRKAEREGIGLERFDWLRHGEKFLPLMAGTEQRHGRRPAYGADFFRALAALADADERVQWVWCEHGGRAACSHIYFLEDGVLQGWQIYFDKRFSFLKPNQYIRFTMCRRMAARGVGRLNLGGTPENAPGLAAYKRRWGGQPYRYPRHALARGPGRWFQPGLLMNGPG
ncbi:MAG: GNAT family N-acetyltransferase [Candidatus Krumholzibacteriia bacterium]